MLFCTWLCRHCTTTTWKCPISRIVEDVNTKQRLCFSFPELRYPLSEFNSRKELPAFDELNEMEFARWSLKQRDFTLYVTFSSQSPSLLLNLPITDQAISQFLLHPYPLPYDLAIQISHHLSPLAGQRYVPEENASHRTRRCQNIALRLFVFLQSRS